MKAKEIMKGKPRLRKALLKTLLHKYCKYYFSQYFDFPTPEFIKPFYKALQDGKNVYFEGFRGSMKTTVFQMYINNCITYKRRRNIMRYSQNKENSTKNLTYVANGLIGSDENKKIIRDFGQLYYDDDGYKGQKRQKSTSRFVTENECQVLAMSLGVSPRGENFTASDGKFRPELVGFDDVDTLDSCATVKKIDKRREFILNEIFGGLTQHTQIVFLGNTIYDDGIVRRMEKHIQDDPNWVIIKQPIYDEKGKIVWDKFVETDEEAKKTNKNITDIRRKVISLETEKRQLGSTSFGQNYLLKPYVRGTRIISMSDIIIRDLSTYEFDRIECGVDPAISQKDGSDAFAFVVSAFDGNKRYVLEAVELNGKEKSHKNIMKIAKYLFIKWKLNIFKVEAVAYQAILEQLFKDAGLPTEAIHPHKDKVTRLLQWQGAFENGDIIFSSVGTQALIDQLLEFPDGDHDDLVDALVYSLIPADERKIFV